MAGLIYVKDDPGGGVEKIEINSLDKANEILKKTYPGFIDFDGLICRLSGDFTIEELTVIIRLLAYFEGRH